jgi:hypothetical protein
MIDPVMVTGSADPFVKKITYKVDDDGDKRIEIERR